MKEPTRRRAASRAAGKATSPKTATKRPTNDATRKRRVAGTSGNGRRTSEDPILQELLDALVAFRQGDLEVRMPARRAGVGGQIAAAFNECVELMERMTGEIDRVARVVGREGRMSERADLPGTTAWSRKLSSMNALIDDLIRPTTEIGRVIDAVARGDLSQRISLNIEGRPVKGEFLRIGTAVNQMVDQLSSFGAEVSRVAKEVGTDGKLGGQARVKGVSGRWKDLTDNVNLMASNLTAQVRDIAQVATAVAKGDLSQKITVDVAGEMLELKNTVNTMVDQLSSFADEVTRVAREVGTEGKLGGQAQVRGVSGTWKDLTDSVNSMAFNLTAQVRNIAQVATAVARGDLSQTITVDVKGEILELKNTVNTMVDQLSSFADEVTRVAREVGTEGKLGGQAQVRGVSGTWKDLTDSVNLMASNLTSQVRDIARVTTAVARGDLSPKITVDVKGEILELKNTINTMVDQLRAFAGQVTRVAREVGSEGKLGGQAEVLGAAGTWKDLTDSVNFMASNLTSQVRDIAHVTTAVAKGDLSQKITVDVRGEMLELKNTVNTMVDQLSSFADEVTRVAREVGTEGKLGGQAAVPGVAGTWKDLTENVNSMASNLTGQVRNIAQVTTAVAKGDLSQKITVDVKGEILELKNTINTMVDQLRAFGDEVTRVAREVGTDGRLGGQARVPGVSGTWKDLTESVNFMASNLTAQVRNIAQVATAVAGGDLSQKITVDVKGEILELKNTINTMVDQLSSFADEVTRVAHEVGTEGKLGGQAEVEGVSGTWGHLTESVNQLAQNLTTQVRAIADVATSVTQGDLTRAIDVGAQGEVAELKDNINQMIRNLRETTRKNAEQDWLKSNLARISGMMQGQRDLRELSRLVMSEVTPVVSAQYGAFFMAEGEGDQLGLRLVASYAYRSRKRAFAWFGLGEGLVGQAAAEKKPILVADPPEDYMRISSGLGEARPAAILVLPVVFEGQVIGVIELGSFRPFSDVSMMFLEQLVETIGVVLNGVIANMKREELLAESQRLAHELQSQSRELQKGQEKLRQTNIELEEKARLLEDQNRNIELKNREIGIARVGLEEKAKQLSLASKYKSEFLANMSHELRTPLNSLMVLSQLLASNPDGNLSRKQVEFANTIYAAGRDLLNLINDILDLTKVEAGRLDISPADIAVEDIRDSIEQAFRPLAEQKGLWLTLTIGADCPAVVRTDPQRLQQILNNLLSNAVKFTTEGGVTIRIDRAPHGIAYTSSQLAKADPVIAFTVSDTGIGIPPDKLEVIFEAFRQADGTTNRRFGGTGLGLSISREIARLLGAEIRVESSVDQGSTFALYLPSVYIRPESLGRDELQGHQQASDGAGVSPGESVAPARPAVDDDSDGASAGASLLAHPVDSSGVLLDVFPLGGKRILVVDDDLRNVFALTNALEIQGIEVMVAESGREALDVLLRTPNVDAILMDIMMPELDGYQAIEAIRNIPQFADLPIIALTAKAMKGDRESALAAGATDYIAKPVEIDDLVTKIRGTIYR